MISLVVADGSELFLLLTPDKASFVEVFFYLLWISAEGEAQRFKRIKLLVSQEHINARNQYGRVFGQIVHIYVLLKVYFSCFPSENALPIVFPSWMYV